MPITEINVSPCPNCDREDHIRVFVKKLTNGNYNGWMECTHCGCRVENLAGNKTKADCVRQLAFRWNTLYKMNF